MGDGADYLVDQMASGLMSCGKAYSNKGRKKMSEENNFVDGMFVSKRDNAPEFVLCSLSFFEPKFAEYMAKNVNGKGYVNMDILMSKSGKPYAKLNTWKPATKDSQETPQEQHDRVEQSYDSQQQSFDDIPF